MLEVHSLFAFNAVSAFPAASGKDAEERSHTAFIMLIDVAVKEPGAYVVGNHIGGHHAHGG